MPRTPSIVLCMALFACPKGENPTTPEPGPSKPTSFTTRPSEKGDATVRGRVRFEGRPPEQTQLRVARDGFCMRAHPEPIALGDVKVSEGRVQDAFVYIRAGAPRSEPPAKAVTLDQDRCNYTPRILGLQLGQSLVVGNSDATLHNVHSKHFNIASPPHRPRPLVFDEPEVMVKLSCDLHPWMTAYVGVVPHAFFTVTGTSGAYRFDALPPGPIVIAAWHERLGTSERSVAIEGAGVIDLDLTLPGPSAADP